ncbi:unnamed protein product [Eruca vesicaria subsp. sativa]|uniref:Transmembrane protein n=1 Tax=Eruca vesicaria subsp. sativa TaxID=29727 RepID=A0ABC8JZH9_ERUVS|nr:unnamed protein product [Eruca vesicaria subsp. sativa]
MLCGSFRNRVNNWLRDYVRLQSVVVILIYAQIGCAMIGSLGALYNGVLLINLAIALFALVAIESNSQSLGRTYAVLLFCAILLDISWLILFSNEIWNISSEMYKALYIFSVKLTMVMEIAGFVVRLSSSLLWFQIYRLGASIVDTSLPRRSDSDSQNSFIDPPTLGSQRERDPDLRTSLLEPPAIAEHRSRSDQILDDSIDRVAYQFPPFNDGPAYQFPPCDGGQNNLSSPKVIKHHSAENIYGGSQLSAAEVSRLKSPLSRSLESLDSSLHRFNI